jgi:hypothetical protein
MCTCAQALRGPQRRAETRAPFTAEYHVLRPRAAPADRRLRIQLCAGTLEAQVLLVRERAAAPVRPPAGALRGSRRSGPGLRAPSALRASLTGPLAVAQG